MTVPAFTVSRGALGPGAPDDLIAYIRRQVAAADAEPVPPLLVAGE